MCLQKEVPNSEFEVSWLQVIPFSKELTHNYSHLPYHNHWPIPLLLSFIKRLLPSKESVTPHLSILISHTVMNCSRISCLSPQLRFQNYSSQFLTNCHNLTASQPHCWSHVQTFSPSSSHILQTYLSPKAHFHRNSNLHSFRLFWKSLAHQNLSSRTSNLNTMVCPALSSLKNRTSFVKIDSSFSPCTTICTGVPQGSVLGPLFFFSYHLLPI